MTFFCRKSPFSAETHEIDSRGPAHRAVRRREIGDFELESRFSAMARKGC